MIGVSIVISSLSVIPLTVPFPYLYELRRPTLLKGVEVVLHEGYSSGDSVSYFSA